MQADSNLMKLTASNFQVGVLNTQDVNENMPNMIPIANLNENLMDCNENLAWGEQNPSFIPMCFGTQQKVKKW